MPGQHSQAIRTVRFFPNAEPQAPAQAPTPCAVFASVDVGVPPAVFDSSLPQPNLHEGHFVVIHAPGTESRAH